MSHRQKRFEYSSEPATVALGKGPPGSGPSAGMVGRRAEIEWLESCLEDVRAGHPQVVLIQGEQGIGKSRLARELAVRATRAGFESTYCRCQESFSLPYLPLQDSLFPRLSQLARSETSEAAIDTALARLLVGHGESDASNPHAIERGDPNEAQHQRTRLLFALTNLTLQLARSGPHLLIADDLQWADEPSFDFLVQLGLRLSDARMSSNIPLLLVLVTRHELAEARSPRLARLSQDDICSTIELPGLNRIETAEMLRNRGLQDVTAEVSERVQRVTGGNPLFLDAVTSALIPGGPDTASTGARDRYLSVEDMTIPAELSQAIARRAEGLSDSCRQFIEAMSLAVSGSKIETLSSTLGLEDQSTRSVIDEASTSGFVDRDHDTLHFRQPLYRAHFRGAIPAKQKQELHARLAAEIIAKRSDATDLETAELAEHLIQAGEFAKPEEVLKHASRAAEAAASVFAWIDAARLYKCALRASRHVATPIPEQERARLLYRAGLACDLAMDGDSAIQFLDEAIPAFETLGDLPACILGKIAVARCVVAGGRVERSQTEIEALETMLDGLGESDHALRADASAHLAQLRYMRGDFEGAGVTARKAIEYAGQSSQTRAQVRATSALALVHMIQVDLDQCLATLDEGHRIARLHGDPQLIYESDVRRPMVLFWLGRLHESVESANEILGLGERINDPMYNIMPLASIVLASTACGHFAVADRYGYDALLSQRLSGYTWVNGMFLGALVSAHVRRGSWEKAREAMALWATENDPRSWSYNKTAAWIYEQYIRANAGDLEAVRRELAAYPERLRVSNTPFLGVASVSCVMIELAWMLKQPSVAESATGALTAVSRKGQVFAEATVFHIPRVLGIAALLAEDLDSAIRLLSAAVANCDELGASSEHALALLNLAEALLLRHRGSDEARALDLLRLAQVRCDELGMTPTAERVQLLAKRSGESLDRAARASTALEGRSQPRRAVTIMFTDLERSTDLLRSLGDQRAYEIIYEHYQIIRGLLDEHSGTEVERQGDGILAAFETPAAGLRCAIAIQRSLANYSPADIDQPIRVRIGLHSGDTIQDERKFFGITVVLASRISANAKPEEILISSTLHEVAADTDEFEICDHRMLELRGFDELQDVYSLAWS